MSASKYTIPMKTVPNGFQSWNPACRGAYRKGYEAGSLGKSQGECPYKDVRKWDGKLTWSRAFEIAWHDGWHQGRQDHPITAYYSDRARSGNSTSSSV